MLRSPVYTEVLDAIGKRFCGDLRSAIVAFNAGSCFVLVWHFERVFRTISARFCVECTVFASLYMQVADIVGLRDVIFILFCSGSVIVQPFFLHWNPILPNGPGLPPALRCDPPTGIQLESGTVSWQPFWPMMPSRTNVLSRAEANTPSDKMLADTAGMIWLDDSIGTCASALCYIRSQYILILSITYSCDVHKL